MKEGRNYVKGELVKNKYNIKSETDIPQFLLTTVLNILNKKLKSKTSISYRFKNNPNKEWNKIYYKNN